MKNQSESIAYNTVFINTCISNDKGILFKDLKLSPVSDVSENSKNEIQRIQGSSFQTIRYTGKRVRGV